MSDLKQSNKKEEYLVQKLFSFYNSNKSRSLQVDVIHNLGRSFDHHGVPRGGSGWIVGRNEYVDFAGVAFVICILIVDEY